MPCLHLPHMYNKLKWTSMTASIYIDNKTKHQSKNLYLSVSLCLSRMLASARRSPHKPVLSRLCPDSDSCRVTRASVVCTRSLYHPPGRAHTQTPCDTAGGLPVCLPKSHARTHFFSYKTNLLLGATVYLPRPNSHGADNDLVSARKVSHSRSRFPAIFPSCVHLLDRGTSRCEIG